MRVAVKDTSILIDLAEGDLLGLWFKLQIETHTTDLILSELRDEGQWQHVSAFVDAGLLRRHTAPPAEFAEVIAYHQGRGISIADASGILLAKRLQACLLTGDLRMRGAARDDGLEVRGVLWILDELVAKEVLAKPDAADRLERICAAGSRLPRVECDARIKAWRG